jgi:hypothetical protein
VSRPFEYCWTFLGGSAYHCRAVESEPGIITFFQRREGEEDEERVEKPMGLTNELVQLVLDARRMRCELAAAGAGTASCSECDDYDPEAIAACPYCNKPVCDGCMHNWHTNGICCPEE